MESTPVTPSRRSKRFQPLVTPVKTDSFVDKTVIWTDAPCYTRPTVYEDYQVLQEDEGWQPGPGVQTVFRKSFKRTKNTAPASRKGMSGRGSTIETETFEVGDTVLVKTQSTRHPSVGVIASMWEFKGKEIREDDSPQMMVRVHWFQHPSELPRIRAKREHLEVSGIFANCHPLIPTTRTKYILLSLHRLSFRLHVYYHIAPFPRFHRRKSAQSSKTLQKKVATIPFVIVTTRMTNLHQSPMTNSSPPLLTTPLIVRQLLVDLSTTFQRHRLASANTPYPHPSLRRARNVHRSSQHPLHTPKRHYESEVEKHQPSVFRLRISHRSTTINCKTFLRIRGFVRCTSFMLRPVLMFSRAVRRNIAAF
jgi:hypothetical protein